MKHLLRDWRVWAFAVGAMLTAAMISMAFGGRFGAGGAGGGAVTGLFVAFRMRTLRSCPSCGAAVHISAVSPTGGVS